MGVWGLILGLIAYAGLGVVVCILAIMLMTYFDGDDD